MERLWCVLAGYLFGSFLTADLIVFCRTGARRAEGFGNPGMANVASRLGAGSGLLVLAGDILKTAAACALCRLWLFPGMGRMAVLYAGLGAVLGHCWPVWNGFRGGKGVAVVGAASILFSPPRRNRELPARRGGGAGDGLSRGGFRGDRGELSALDGAFRPRAGGGRGGRRDRRRDAAAAQWELCPDARGNGRPGLRRVAAESLFEAEIISLKKERRDRRSFVYRRGIRTP